MENWWNDVPRGKQKFSKNIVPQCPVFYYESPIELSGFEPRPPRWETCDSVMTAVTINITAF